MALRWDYFVIAIVVAAILVNGPESNLALEYYDGNNSGNQVC